MGRKEHGLSASQPWCTGVFKQTPPRRSRGARADGFLRASNQASNQDQGTRARAPSGVASL